MSASVSVPAVTCLGCGCTCDDITLTLDGNAIVAAERACPLGLHWFGNGAAPALSLIDGTAVDRDAALEHAVTVLSRARRPRLVLAPDLSSEAYAEALACADLLHARVDIASPSAATLAMAVQERGIATATLGEIRNRADVIVFWAVDPATRFPRYASRYAPDPIGTHLPDGRRQRTVIAVDIEGDRGPADADARVGVPRATEIDTLAALAAILDGNTRVPAIWETAVHLAEPLRAARYAVVVADVTTTGAATGRLHRLLALGHALNTHSRGALSLLRAGGNQCGAEAVMTRQTGYPAAIDFASRLPRYRPLAGTTDHDVVLWVGSTRALDESASSVAGSETLIGIGPGLSDAMRGRASVVIDTGVAGIHSSGTAVRMDEVPLPLKQVLAGPPDAAELCGVIRTRLMAIES